MGGGRSFAASTFGFFFIDVLEEESVGVGTDVGDYGCEGGVYGVYSFGAERTEFLGEFTFFVEDKIVFWELLN